MTIYARVQDGTVMELLELPAGIDIGTLFHPSLTWIALKGAQIQNVIPGYTYDGSSFTAPAPLPEPEPAAEPTKAELLAQIAALMAKVEALPDSAA